MRQSFLAGFVAACLAIPFAAHAGELAPKGLTILYSADERGEITPCG